MNVPAGTVWRYMIAAGSNQWHVRHGCPRRILAAAARTMTEAVAAVSMIQQSRIVMTRPIGPSRRQFANAVWHVETAMEPDALLDCLHGIEAQFGRRRRGQRWSARVLDLDIILWSGGPWISARLCIPHPRWRERRFVTDPMLALAERWPDPHMRRMVRHVSARQRRPQPRQGD